MTTDRCFVDTVCWIALLNQDDRLHKSTDRKYKSLMKCGYRFITTTQVLNETANALSDPRFRLSVVEFYRRLQASSRIEIVFIDPRLWSEGWQLYSPCVFLAFALNPKQAIQARTQGRYDAKRYEGWALNL